MSHPDRNIEDHAHDWEQVDTIPWDNSDQFHTVVYICSSDQCDAKWVAREETAQTQATDWM